MRSSITSSGDVEHHASFLDSALPLVIHNYFLCRAHLHASAAITTATAKDAAQRKLLLTLQHKRRKTMSLEQGACSTKPVPFAINPMVARITCKDRGDSGLCSNSGGGGGAVYQQVRSKCKDCRKVKSKTAERENGKDIRWKRREKRGEVIKRHASKAIGREGGRDKIHGLAGGEERVILPNGGRLLQ